MDHTCKPTDEENDCVACAFYSVMILLHRMGGAIADVEEAQGWIEGDASTADRASDIVHGTEAVCRDMKHFNFLGGLLNSSFHNLDHLLGHPLNQDA